MRIAVVADVHANEAALDAVLDALSSERVDRILGLGDSVGYNARPLQCVRKLQSVLDACVMGNHDWAALHGEALAGTSDIARTVTAWTRARLDASTLDYLGALPAVHVDPSGVLLGHGCFLNDTFHRGYVTSTMLGANLRAVAARHDWPAIAMCGHTHLPMCGWLAGGEVCESNGTAPVAWPVGAEAVLINPGSVGQPRDGDPRASFALIDLDERCVEVRRVPYDVASAVACIEAAGLPDVLGRRLREGR